MSEVLSATNLKFLAQGMWTTLYLSFFIIVLSTLFGTILAVMRNGKNPILRWMASIYVEFVRNVPNLLWIFIIFLAQLRRVLQRPGRERRPYRYEPYRHHPRSQGADRGGHAPHAEP